jgi:hypothetical protein
MSRRSLQFLQPPLGPIALFPGWGRVTPFGIELSKHQVPGPDLLSSLLYALDLNLLKSIGDLNSSTRTAEQTQIAFFWYEEPSFKWNRIANTVIRQRNLDDWQAARILALMNFAIADGLIACLEAKYRFRFWRPYTAIRRAGEDGNPLTEPDRAWQPLFSSPPFIIPPIPEYPSALAVSGTTAAEVLIRNFGDHVQFETTSATLPNVTRRFDSFTKAAVENGLSRVYGGIHFLRAVHDGFELGKGIGQDISRLLPSVH